MNGDQQEPPVPLRLPPDSSAIEAGVLQFMADNPAPQDATVTPLNAGFFQLEAMRTASTVTAKAKTAAKRQPESSGE